MKAHHHFSDPEWDGEPIEPDAARPRPSDDIIEPVPVDGERSPTEPRPARIQVKLADGKARQIQSMMATTFWSADGRPMSAAQFLESLFGALPEFFRDEDHLRELWSDPTTRKALLRGLADKGFSREALADIRKAIEAEKCDLFDVLSYVAFARPPLTREARAQMARGKLSAPYLAKRQKEFLEFVLGHYVDHDVDELDLDKLSPLLRLRYHAIADATADLGSPEEIRSFFVGFQRHLYAAPIQPIA